MNNWDEKSTGEGFGSGNAGWRGMREAGGAGDGEGAGSGGGKGGAGSGGGKGGYAAARGGETFEAAEAAGGGTRSGTRGEQT